MRTIAVAFTALTLITSPVLGQSEAPSWDKGTVWDFGQIKTVDGHFDDYMKWLAGRGVR
jgi:hypothetical protein